MSRYLVTVNGKQHQVRLTKRTEAELEFLVNEKEVRVQIQPDPNSFLSGLQPLVNTTGSAKTVASAAKAGSSTELRAPMPGVVVEMLVKKGEQVTGGQTLCILEAMKMENGIQATHDGIVEEVLVAKGAQVETDQLLISFAKK